MLDYFKLRVLSHDKFIAALEDSFQKSFDNPEKANKLQLEIVIAKIQRCETLICMNHFINQNRAQR